MSDNPQSKPRQAPEPEKEELNQDEQEKISGGGDGVKGESQEGQHKDW